MLKCVFIVFLLTMVDGFSFHLHNTEVSVNADYKDCLYSFTFDSSISEWQLVPYCIRQNTQETDDENDRCNGNLDYTFDQLKSQNIDSHHLYEWNAPIDLINDYQKYLTNHDLTLASRHYCNCSGEKTTYVLLFADLKEIVSRQLVWHLV